jgi:hypothetical protein
LLFACLQVDDRQKFLVLVATALFFSIGLLQQMIHQKENVATIERIFDR